MKSIFRKIAFVLALVMVVTMFPVMNASAANNGNKYARNKNATLFVGGDITGDYAGCWAAQTTTKTWMKEEGYKSAYKSSNETVATVSKYGYVEAVGVGTATITATFSKGGNSIVETFDVIVKKNANNVALDKESEEALKVELSTGDKLTLKATMTDANGNADPTITDTIKFYMSNKAEKEIIDINQTTGELTALKEGKATILVRSYQWAYDREAKKNVSKVTAESSYDVVVKNKMAAQQTAFNAFTVTFDNAETAKAAAGETRKYLGRSDAAVTEKEDIIKVFEVLKDTKEDVNEVVRVIGYAQEAENVVTVRMFDELEEDTDYVIRYMDQWATVRTTKNVAETIKVFGENGEVITEDSSRTDIVVRIYAKGVNGQDVDITECRKYRGWQDSVTILDVSSDRSGYNLIIGQKNVVIPSQNDNKQITASAEVYFFNKSASIKVRAEFWDYFSYTSGRKLVSTPDVTIKAGDRGYKDGALINWGILNVGDFKDHDKGAFSVHKLAAEDYGKQLVVQAKITYQDGTPADKCNCGHTGLSLFTFKSQNEDKLIVDEATGALFPAKVPQDTIVNVYVFYDGHYVGYCPVEILAKRTLTSFTMQVNGNTKLSYNPNEGVDDIIEVELKPLDQLEQVFTTNMSINVKMYGVTSNNAYLTSYLEFYGSYADALVGSTRKLPVAADGQLSVNLALDGTYKVWIKGTRDLPTAVRDIRLLGTATYSDGVSQRSLNASANFSAKNTNGQPVRTYQIVTSGNADMNLTDSNAATKSKVTIQAYSIDRDGFKVAHLDLTPAYTSAGGANNTITVNQFGTYMDSTHLTKSGRDVEFKTVAVGSTKTVSSAAISSISLSDSDLQRYGYKNYTVVSSSAISNAVTDGRVLEKIQVGNYQVTLRVDNVYKAGSVIEVVDNEPFSWTWINRSLEYAVGNINDIVEAVNHAFTFDDRTKATGVYVGRIEAVKDGAGTVTGYNLITKDDFVVQGEYVAVKQVRCLREYNGEYYEVVIPIDRSLKVVVIH